MFVEKQDYTKKIVQNARGGNGEVTFSHVVFGENLPENCKLISTIQCEPGCSIGFHKHENETEMYFMLCGELVVDDDGEKKLLKAGDCILTGDGFGHGVENQTNETATFLAIIISE